LELTAAAISLAASADGEPLPGALRERLEHEARAYFSAQAAPAANDGGRDSPSSTGVIAPRAFPADRAASAPGPDRYRRRGPAAGWWAAAACLLLALYSWYRTPQTVFMPVETVQREAPAPEPTPEMQRAALLARADTLKIPLGATKDPGAAGVTGDVVWDSHAQRGYMRLVGLRHNDPSAQQYQMWIFDGGRDSRYPVDGGIFNAPADGREIVIPIHNVIPIHDAKAFAVTVEKAGGVVVSARDHVIVLAQAT
jgi:predicted enzyme related to lactoylglutathione lyase